MRSRRSSLHSRTVTLQSSMVLLLGVLVAGLCPRSAHAGLQWDRTIAELRAAPSAKEVEAEFTFKNTGNKPVRITRVVATCGCTTARTPKESFAPGESGNITVRFEFGDRRGLQQKRITVRTDDPQQPETQLALSVQIEEAVELDRTLLLWRRGEPSEVKTILVTTLTEGPVKLLAAEIVGEGFTAKLEEKEAGKRYVVTVVPTDTSAPAAAQVALRVQRYGAEPETVYARARVK